MAQRDKARVFMSGGSQAVRIPAQFRFATEEVHVRRDARNGDIILSERPGRMEDILAALDDLGVPDDFLSPDERAQPLDSRAASGAQGIGVPHL